MVNEGLGISLLPRMMFPENIEGRTLLPLDPPQYIQIGLAAKSFDLATPDARLFMQIALA
jgi:DNA-binding transcriptional LysR family regulator